MNDIIKGRIFSGGTLRGKLDNNAEVKGKIGIPETIYVRELRFANHYEFPNVGDPQCLYIATDENKTFYYDETTHTYNCVGSNYEDIDTIQCRLKEE